MTKKEEKQMNKSLAKKWEELVNRLDVNCGGLTLAVYDGGEDIQKTALDKIQKMEKQIKKLKEQLDYTVKNSVPI